MGKYLYLFLVRASFNHSQFMYNSSELTLLWLNGRMGDAGFDGAPDGMTLFDDSRMLENFSIYFFFADRLVVYVIV